MLLREGTRLGPLGLRGPRLGQDRKSEADVDFWLIVHGLDSNQPLSSILFSFPPRPPSSSLSSPLSLSPSLPLSSPLLPSLPAPINCPGSPFLPRHYPQLSNSLSLSFALDHTVPLPCPRISSCVHLPCRMSQLSLSWMGLGHTAASPWLLLLLAGASCLLAYILTQIYGVFENSLRLRCFPQPPKRNWILGHLGLVSVVMRWVWGFRVKGIVKSLE